MSKSLYKVKIQRTSYRGEKSFETRELFAESPKKINTYRLGGFQQDSIQIVSAKKIRDRKTIEIDADLERNELSFSVSVDDHLESTLVRNKQLEYAYRNDNETELDIEEFLEAQGYKESTADNTYNHGSDFENEIQFTVYSKSGSKDWFYDNSAVLVAYEHTGLDVRAGYKFKGIFSPGKWDGFSYFLDFHVRLTVVDSKGEHVDDFDGDGATYNLLKEYKLKSVDLKSGSIELEKDGETFTLSYYHPAGGV